MTQLRPEPAALARPRRRPRQPPATRRPAHAPAPASHRCARRTPAHLPHPLHPRTQLPSHRCTSHAKPRCRLTAKAERRKPSARRTERPPSWRHQSKKDEQPKRRKAPRAEKKRRNPAQAGADRIARSQVQAQLDGERAREAARVETARAERERRKLDRAQKAELERGDRPQGRGQACRGAGGGSGAHQGNR